MNEGGWSGLNDREGEERSAVGEIQVQYAGLAIRRYKAKSQIFERDEARQKRRNDGWICENFDRSSSDRKDHDGSAPAAQGLCGAARKALPTVLTAAWAARGKEQGPGDERRHFRRRSSTSSQGRS